jgi:putative spermidine/putrescine transport system permease protein
MRRPPSPYASQPVVFTGFAIRSCWRWSSYPGDLLPTMILVQLQFPRLQPGFLNSSASSHHGARNHWWSSDLAPRLLFRSVARDTRSSSIWTARLRVQLSPCCHTRIDAIQSTSTLVDVVTLAEAARSRSVPAGWRCAVAGHARLRRGILAAAVHHGGGRCSGEFTIASLLSRGEPCGLLVPGSRGDPFVAVIFSPLALAFAFVLLLLIGRLASDRHAAPRRRPHRSPPSRTAAPQPLGSSMS